MIPIGRSCRGTGSGGVQSTSLSWLVQAIAAALLGWFATAAVKSGGLDRLLLKEQSSSS